MLSALIPAFIGVLFIFITDSKATTKIHSLITCTIYGYVYLPVCYNQIFMIGIGSLQWNHFHGYNCYSFDQISAYPYWHSPDCPSLLHHNHRLQVQQPYGCPHIPPHLLQVWLPFCLYNSERNKEMWKLPFYWMLKFTHILTLVIIK